MRSPAALSLILSLCCWSVVACGDDGGGSSVDTSKESVAAVPCTDESVGMLNLRDEPNPAEVRNDPKDEGFLTEVDATGGGVSATLSYVYAKFTDEGLTTVALSDEEAFASKDWDIALRRYIIRLNSGVSGPGKVTGARTKPKTDWASVKSVPDGLEFRAEQYFTDSCDFIDDSSGIGGPGTALASFWSYSNCLAMTHNVYIIELAQPKKRHVKLEVMAYYYPDRQMFCDENGRVPEPSGAGNVQLRWAFID